MADHLAFMIIHTYGCNRTLSSSVNAHVSIFRVKRKYVLTEFTAIPSEVIRVHVIVYSTCLCIFRTC